MRKISLVLLITGIVVGVSPLVGQLYNRYRENRMMDEWLNSIDAQELEAIVGTDPEEAYSSLQEVFESENPRQVGQLPGNFGGCGSFGECDGRSEPAGCVGTPAKRHQNIRL